jgi:hypothetical protein
MREPLARSKMVDKVKSQETRTVVKKRDGGMSYLVRRRSPSRSLAQVAIALVMYKLKRGGVRRRGAQCAVGVSCSFLSCRVGAVEEARCKAAGQGEQVTLGRFRVAAWGCLHFTMRLL